MRLRPALHYYGGYLEDHATNSEYHWVLDLDHTGAGWVNAAPLPNTRGHFSGAAWNGKFHAIGSAFGHDAPSNTVDTNLVYDYNLVMDSWDG